MKFPTCLFLLLSVTFAAHIPPVSLFCDTILAQTIEEYSVACPSLLQLSSEQRRRYTQAIRNSPLMICITDPEGRVLFRNYADLILDTSVLPGGGNEKVFFERLDVERSNPDTCYPIVLGPISPELAQLMYPGEFSKSNEATQS